MTDGGGASGVKSLFDPLRVDVPTQILKLLWCDLSDGMERLFKTHATFPLEDRRMLILFAA
jgi:hypothetical protein